MSADQGVVELLDAVQDGVPSDGQPLHSGITTYGAVNLYINHALSTWNARGYEFAAASRPSPDYDSFPRREERPH